MELLIGAIFVLLLASAGSRLILWDYKKHVVRNKPPKRGVDNEG